MHILNKCNKNNLPSEPNKKFIKPSIFCCHISNTLSCHNRLYRIHQNGYIQSQRHIFIINDIILQTFQHLVDSTGIPVLDHSQRGNSRLHIFELVVNIPIDHSKRELTNGYKIRRAAIDHNIPLITNARLASAFINAFCEMKEEDIQIKSWQEYK